MVMWFGYLFKFFRSVSLDLTGYVYSYGPLEVNLFVEKQVMLPATLPDIESEILCCKYIFCQNNLVQGTELTINMNCGFNSFELDNLFFLEM